MCGFCGTAVLYHKNRENFGGQLYHRLCFRKQKRQWRKEERRRDAEVRAMHGD